VSEPVDPPEPDERASTARHRGAEGVTGYDVIELERILVEDGWVVTVQTYSNPTHDRSQTWGYLVSLTAPTGKRFDANGWSRSTALCSAALLAGLIEPVDAETE
jgi:hypothetical protein